jgi:DNA-binding IclR family transcriptional regulator
MLKRSRKRKEDGVESARRVADRVIVLSGDTPDEPTMKREIPSEISLHASAMGRLGGPKGGRARAAALSPERRTEIARDAARKRWKKTD